MQHLLSFWILFASLLIAGCGDPINHENLQTKTIKTQPATDNRIPGQYIVTFKAGGDLALLNELFARYGVKKITRLTKERYLLVLEVDPGPEMIANLVAATSEIKHFQPNYSYRALTPSQTDLQRPR